ncbi:MAG TPA: cysteine peptidase family C39 domain-containing protein, partial [Burkholderiaceae bacterium]|nr:cysteine peptidase family C39 domain-containing protein [Burkholderiaceae bacterium]
MPDSDMFEAARLQFGWRRQPPLILQAEAAECGLACLAMVAAFHGLQIDLATLRRRFALSLKGLTLHQLMGIAERLELGARPLKLELEEMSQLVMPCVLHWGLNHFVVLVSADSKGIRILDPAQGSRQLSWVEASRGFTGVAVEFSPTPSFQPQNLRRSMKLQDLLGPVKGLRKTLLQVGALAIALEIFALIAPFFMQWVVDGAIVSADRDLLAVIALGFALLVLIQVALGIARSWVVLFVSTHLGLQWSARVLSHLLRLPTSWFERRHLGDVVSRFGAVNVIEKTLTTNFLEAIVDGLLAVTTLAMMLIYSGQLTAVVLVSMLAYGVLRWVAYRPIRVAIEEKIALDAKADSIFLESVRAVSALKLFGREGERRVRWVNAVVDATNRDLSAQKMTIGFRAAQ